LSDILSAIPKSFGRRIIRDNPIDGVQSNREPIDLAPVEELLPFSKEQVAALQRIAWTKPTWPPERWWISPVSNDRTQSRPTGMSKSRRRDRP